MCSFFYASNEPKSVIARDLGDCRDNLRTPRIIFRIVTRVGLSWLYCINNSNYSVATVPRGVLT